MLWIIIDDGPSHNGLIPGGGQMAFSGPTRGVFKHRVVHSQQCGFLVHDIDKGFFAYTLLYNAATQQHVLVGSPGVNALTFPVLAQAAAFIVLSFFNPNKE